MKTISTIIATFFALLTWGQSSQIKISNSSGKVFIKWAHQKDLKYAAMLIPIYFEKDSTEYLMQLDFGAPKTVFYSEEFSSRNLKIGNSEIVLDSMRFVSNKKSSTLIGTIGMDIIEQSSIELNFKDHYIRIGAEKIADHTFHYYQNRIMIPSKIKGEEKILMYDSGTSAFDFVTDQNTWEKMRNPEAEVKVVSANSWGNPIKIHLTQSSEKIEIGGKQVQLEQLAYITGIDPKKEEAVRKSGLQGMIGNHIFLNQIVYFNFKEKKFSLE